MHGTIPTTLPVISEKLIGVTQPHAVMASAHAARRRRLQWWSGARRMIFSLGFGVRILFSLTRDLAHCTSNTCAGVGAKSNMRCRHVMGKLVLRVFGGNTTAISYYSYIKAMKGEGREGREGWFCYCRIGISNPSARITHTP